MAILLTWVAVLLRIISNPLGNVFQKQLTRTGSHPLLINFLTYFILSVPCIIIALPIAWHALPREFWLYAILAGIAGGTGNGFLVKALQKGDLSVLGPINAYKSVVAIIAGLILLGEIPNMWGLLGIGLIVCGSYFVLDTTADRFSWTLLRRPEIKYRIWALILTAIEAVLIKKIILASSTTIAFIAWCWFGALFSFLFLLTGNRNRKEEWQRMAPAHAGRYLALVACIATMQLTTNYAFAHMPVAYALALFQLSTLVSVLLGYKFFRSRISVKSLSVPSSCSQDR